MYCMYCFFGVLPAVLSKKKGVRVGVRCHTFFFEPQGRGLQDVLHALNADGSALGDATTQVPIHEELEVASITSQGE